MPSRILRRLITSSTLMIFGGAMIAAGPVGCSSAPKKVGFESTANPNDESAKLDQAVKDGYAHNYDVLAANDFQNAQDKLAKAKREMAAGDKPETVLGTLGMSRAYMNRAKEKADSLQQRARGILDARSAALDAGAHDHPAAQAALKKVDDDLRGGIDDLARGKMSTERWSKLQRAYLDVETRALQDSKLSRQKAQIYGAIQNGAKKNTPNMLSQAERDLTNAENLIATNRTDSDAINAAAEKSKRSAQLLVDVLAATKRPEGVINEDAARELVLQGRKLRNVGSELGQAQSEVEAQGQQLEHNAAAIKLNKALESARKEFTSQEAEVYRQGDKLLIRLKAVNFPSGRADLPAQALPLLAKVKTIAEELNPQAIVVEGHTDSTGKAQLNKVLSQNRAEAVADYLGTNGLEKDKINAIGRGYDKPLSSNKTKEGRAENRRVDVIITPSISNSSTGQM